MKLWCIHGNLQTSDVWTAFEGKFTCKNHPLRLERVNLWKSPGAGFTEWTDAFCKEVANSMHEEGQILMGYSLGGRLALHAYLKEPELWKGVVIIAADAGTSDQDAKRKHLQADQRWGEKFKAGDLEQVIKEWDALPIFGGLPNSAPRNLQKLDSVKVAACFDHFSKGKQEDLLPALKKVDSPPLLYLSGRQDLKYTKFGQHLEAECPALHHQIIPNAGHRLPWENPDGFVDTVQEFIHAVCMK
jgi:2-succinyl-6-hydroxy-2,4-cyclohexadiene-1-carboxylate synthase